MESRADVVIAGASFAGLAAARALRGHGVLLVDPHPLGAFPKSACGIPLSTVRAFGAEGAVMEAHPALVLHSGRRTVRVPSPSPYVTVDYRRFCELLAEQGGAQLVRAHALGYAAGRVYTSAGEIACRFAVDASGPAAVLASSLRPRYAERNATAAGLEVEVERPAGFPGGLHFYLEAAAAPGYGWAFGCGERLRIGMGVFDAKHQGRTLKEGVARLTAHLGADSGPLHGGLIPLQLREPLVEGLFVVGDAAGQALPTSAEGIRPALYFGQVVGALLARVLAGRLEPEAAREAYRREVARRRWAYRTLARTQGALTAASVAEVSGVLGALQPLGLLRLLHGRYLRGLTAAAA